jgi:hypothetical protein
MTWYKQLNVVDLGEIGSPIMAKLDNGPMMTKYFLNYALPDIIEAHGYFLEKFCSSIFTQEKFKQLYSAVGRRYDMNSVCSGKELNIAIAYWIRNDIKMDSKSSERIFLDDLQKYLEEPRIKNEIESCEFKAEDCSYIARTIYKFIPELRESNQFDSVYSLFSSETDKALLRGWKDGQAHEVIISAVKNNSHFTIQ